MILGLIIHLKLDSETYLVNNTLSSFLNDVEYFPSNRSSLLDLVFSC